MNIYSIALDIAWANPQSNREAAGQLIALAPDDVDIIALPELFTTGFIQDEATLNEVSEEGAGCPTLTWAREMARRADAAICGSYSAKDKGNIFNRAFFITPDGEATFYDKRHLFTPSAENRIYTAGTAPIPVIPFRGWRVAMMVCYDLRFPVWARNTGHRYDMMIVPANWPQARGYAWSHLLIARAIENQAVYVGCDRSGTDDYGDYCGLAMITDAMGMPIHTITRHGTHEILTASPSLDDLRRARRKLPVIDSADSFSIDN